MSKGFPGHRRQWRDFFGEEESFAFAMLRSRKMAGEEHEENIGQLKLLWMVLEN